MKSKCIETTASLDVHKLTFKYLFIRYVNISSNRNATNFKHFTLRDKSLSISNPISISMSFSFFSSSFRSASSKEKVSFPFSQKYLPLSRKSRSSLIKFPFWLYRRARKEYSESATLKKIVVEWNDYWADWIFNLGTNPLVSLTNCFQPTRLLMPAELK